MAGVTDLLFQSLNWKLTSQDDGKVIEGQFMPTDLVQNISANYAQISTLGRAQPILQFQNDELETITFTARIWAPHQGVAGLGAETIEEIVDDIKALPRKDPDLGRPKIWEFTAGESLALVCIVKSIGGVRYDRMRPLDGTLRGVTFSMELWRFDEYDVSLSGGAGAESLVLAFKENESFESLGRRVYGDPNVGEPLRRRNPSLVVPTAGDLVHLPPKQNLTVGFSLEPVSVPLARTERQQTAQRDHFSRRARTYRSHVLGPDWAGA